MRRVVVVGCAGSGKSSLAAELARRTGLPHVERDALGVLGSPEYVAALRSMVGGDGWILDGAPYFADDIVYRAADTVIALDYRKARVVWRALRRTARIQITRVAQGAHQPRQGLGLRDPDHPLRWAWTSHADRRREIRELSLRADLRDASLLVFTRPSHLELWVRSIG